MADPQSPIAPTPPPPSSSPPESQPPSAPAAQLQYYGTPPLLHYGALGASILGPLALLIPAGRKGVSSQLQNMFLGTGAFWGFNQLAYDYTEKSIVQRSNERWTKIFSSFDQGLPTEKARQTKALLEAQKAQRKQAEAERLRKAGEEKEERGLLTRVWMGDEGDDWKQRRIEEDKKALESGKGYSDIILEQIWDVWNQTTGKNKTAGQPEDAPASQGPKKEADGASGEKSP